ncbi:uncharacterized protein LOC110860837 [Folsomia candida]|uniref:Cyanate hydratase n=1 Tax=Folsomia candida TaxID=158441 RepID=A0A226D5Q2_FOLCA|nr:uncharacterized protein LOC110860837 [Folsomia candida]OXA40178.1 Cyanate hydratase [Folsomia candida]
MTFLRISSLLLVTLVTWARADFNFGIAELEKEMGYFGECKGTKINLPMESINKGFGTVPYCTLAVPGKAQLTKECVALCVAEQMGFVDPTTRLYQLDVVTKEFWDSVNSTDPNVRNDKWIIEIQVAAIKKCGVDPKQRFELVDDCIEAQKFDKCIKEAASKECGAKPAE